MKKQYRISAFTLSELLIAVVVIGILAALLLPSLFKESPDKNKAMFRKAYNTLLSAVSSVANDEINYDPSATTALGTDENSVSVLRGFNDTTATMNADGSTFNKFCYLLFSSFDASISASAFNSRCPLASVGMEDLGENAAREAVFNSAFRTPDGITWYYYAPYADTTAANTNTDDTAWPLNSTLFTTKIIVDVNGSASGPNCTRDTGPLRFLPRNNAGTINYVQGTATTCPDPDTFIFGIRYDGRVQVGCNAETGTACVISALSFPTDQRAIDILSDPSNIKK